MTRKLIIELNEDYKVIETLEEIKKQIEKGNTSGYYPNWEIKEDNSRKAKFL